MQAASDNKMIINELPLKNAAVIETEPFVDTRGLFARFFCKRELDDVCNGREIVSVNFSRTLKKGAVRGLHFQYPPQCEIKFARCICGAVYDVIVDVRSGSPTFLQWFGIELSADNMKMILIPEGFAHGFQTLEDNAEMLYLHTAHYAPEFEGALHYQDPVLNITWPLKVTEISGKDRNHALINPDFKGVEL